MDAEKELLAKALEMMAQKMKDTGDITGIFGNTMDSTEKKLKNLAYQYRNSAESIEELDKALKDGSQTALGSKDAFISHARTIYKSSDTVDKETKARIASIRNQIAVNTVLKGFSDIAETTVKAMIDLQIDQAKALLTALQNDTDAFTAHTEMAKLSVDANLKVQKSMLEVGESIGTLMSAISFLLPIGKAAKAVVGVLGVAVAGASKFGGYLAEKAADVEKFKLDVLNKEIQTTIKTYQDASKVGVFFTNGMSEMRTSLSKSNVRFDTFMGAIRASSEDLAQLGGTAGAGAQKVARVFGQMGDYRIKLENLGISTEEQIQYTTEYMATLARAGKLESQRETDLTKLSYEYMVNLKTISAITGEDAKAAEARAKKAAEQAAVQAKLAEMGPEAEAKFKQLIKIFPKAERAIGQILTTGAVTDEQSSVALAGIPALQEMIERGVNNITDDAVTAGDALERSLQDLSLNAGALAGQAKEFGSTVGLAAQHGAALGEAAEIGATTQRQAFQVLNKGIEQTRKDLEKQADTQDPLTKAISQTTVEFDKLKSSLAGDNGLNDAITKFALNVHEQNKADLEKKKAALSQFNGKEGEPSFIEKHGRNILDYGGTALGGLIGGILASPTLVGAGLGAAGGAMAGQSMGLSLADALGLSKNAEGGIVDKPSIAGEAGPEAIIPLSKGKIPLQIDFDPLVRILSQNNNLMEQLTRSMEDSKDIQKQILNASY